MRITREALARAIVKTEHNTRGIVRVQDFDDFPHWKKLSFLCRADDIIRALVYLKERERELILKKEKQNDRKRNHATER